MIGEPLVTYIVLSYNHQKYIQAAIESIVEQDYNNIQLVVIDDGSTDDSVSILEKLQRQYNFELILQANSGVVSALNRGISVVRGDFIVPHASDDISRPGRTAAQVKLLIENPRAGFTVGAIRKISEDGAVLADWPEPERRITKFSDFVAGCGGGIAVSCMYRTSAIKKIEQLDESLLFEDVQLYWRVTDLGYSCLIDLGVQAADYRILPESLGRKNKVPLYEDFIIFLDNYKERDWYAKAYSKALAGLFCSLAEVDRSKAIKLFCLNFRHINKIISIRGFAKLVMPKSLILKFKKIF